MTEQAIRKNVSRDEYLTFEAQSTERHQFYRGEVFAMTGGTFNHAAIAGNLLAIIRNATKGGPCRPMNSAMRIHTPSGLDTYPDLSVYCGQPELIDNESTLLNPVVIVEVLSPTTSSYDRGDKFALYRAVETLRDYLLIDSESIAVEHFRRVENPREWILHEYGSEEENVVLDAIGVELALKEIYEGISIGTKERTMKDPMTMTP